MALIEWLVIGRASRDPSRVETSFASFHVVVDVNVLERGLEKDKGGIE